MLNFDYLKQIPELAELHRLCDLCETRANTEPDSSAINARKALEWLTKAIYKMKGVIPGERTSLFQLTSSETFTGFIADPELMRAVHWIRKVGNLAAHDGTVSRTDAFFTALNLYNLVGGVLIKLGVLKTLSPFDRTLIPTKSGRPRFIVKLENQDKKTTEGQKQDNSAEDFAETLAPEKIAEAPAVKPELSWGDISEAETRRRFIDLMLREAGWEVMETEGSIASGKACVEVEVSGMPNDTGTGYADYVLFGSNGKPLAVIEAKRTSKDANVGKHQAELYADCLEKKYGVRPVIYYTNGFETFCIDGLGYPPRQLFAFHTEKDLELIMSRRNGDQQIADFSVKEEITDRYYQKTAIKKMCEWLNGLHRRGLLVMATGTGKTRTAISLVDVLQRNNRVKNTLFLADRNSLVNQAARNFSKLLPNTSITVLSDKSTEIDQNARITFSTYQTMINYVNTDDKPYSIGRFDLIIIDEAHRSVFGRYGDIFRYFDSLLVGLTATPRDQVDKSTYELLHLEGGEPTDYYEYKTAVEDGYLVDYTGLIRGSKVVNEGIRYDDLSDEEKQQLEQVWEYEQASKDPDEEWEPRNINEREIFKYIYNTDTIDRMLQDLMDNGLKIQSGEMIGKTIIFAMNSKTAKLIVERFNVLYPEYGPHFCEQIDYSINYSQDLIDRFSLRGSLPQIAVSVDMLDTGIDVPDVLNLVFFKRVRSRIKFMQMIGRGTRLSPDIFGAGQHKERFLIFDWGGNFKYFGDNPKEGKAVKTTSLTERLFGVRADIVCALQAPQYQEDEFAKNLHDRLKETLHTEVGNLNDAHISVRNHWPAVSKYRDASAWQYISEVDVLELKNEIAPLLSKSMENELAKKFDLLSLYVMLGIVDENFDSDRHESQIAMIAEALRKRATIPEIKAKMPLLEEMTTLTFWEEKTLPSIENMRKEIRELLKYLVSDWGKTFTVNIEDTVTDGGKAGDLDTTMTYREKVLDFLTLHRDHPVLKKIHNLERLTNEDIDELERILWQELGTKDDYERYLQREQMTAGIPVAAFIRKIVGLDRQKAIRLFSEFISANSLTAEQEEFINNILNYVCQNGDMEKTVIRDNRILRESLMRHFPNQVAQVAKFISHIHDAITVA
ncbi:MAG: DEAD/DEAH box helicase family protein [Muribaculaceae bacterium]|nr:DEAD/DEAH box helicase family protein [Muribaculaceae bacterium]